MYYMKNVGISSPTLYGAYDSNGQTGVLQRINMADIPCYSS